MYGLVRGDSIEVELIAQPEERGFLRRLGEALRIVPRGSATRVRWPDTRNDDRAVVSRSVALRNATLSPGWYTISLSVRVNGGAALTASQRLEVRR
jgi:hypothetical protein